MISTLRDEYFGTSKQIFAFLIMARDDIDEACGKIMLFYPLSKTDEPFEPFLRSLRDGRVQALMFDFCGCLDSGL